MIVASFDLGIVNFACVVARFEIECHELDRIPLQIMNVFHIDITTYTHHHISKSECKLKHTNEISDRLLHTLQELTPHLKDVDLFLIERQPMNSTCSSIEELMFQKYRDRIKKVSPNRMHKRFHLSDQYEVRKLQSVALAEPFLRDFNVFQVAERKHDQSDALLLACSHMLDMKKQIDEERVSKRRRVEVEQCLKQGIDDFFKTYRHQENTAPIITQ